MKKADQISVNAKVDEVMNELEKISLWNSISRRLRSCSAVVYDTPNFYVLRSYRTIIAVIDKRSDTLYDFLRKVYGYTSTSSQHISKFAHDYGSSKWGCENRLTWRYVSE